MTFEEWWINYTTPELRADLKYYYSLTYETIRAIVESEKINPTHTMDIKISSYPIHGRTIGFKFALVKDGEVLHERDLTPSTVLGLNDLYEEEPTIPRFYQKNGKLHRLYGGKEEAGKIIDGKFIADK